MLYWVVVAMGILFLQVNADDCGGGVGASSVNEEIIKMLETAKFSELFSVLAADVSATALNTIEKCLHDVRVLSKAATMITDGGGDNPTVQEYRNSEVLGFKKAYDALLSPLVQDAEAIENVVNEASERRLIQMDIATGFKELWLTMRRIRRENEKTLQSMDIFLKDKIMEKSAEIGEHVLKGNEGNRWSAASAEEELRSLDEVKNVNKMINIYNQVLSSPDVITMHNEMLENYLTSQVAVALRKTDLESSVTSERVTSFGEVAISSGIKEAMILNRESLSVGYEEAKVYAERVNSTVTEFRKLTEYIDQVAKECSSEENCEQVKKYILESTDQLVSYWAALNKVAAGRDSENYRNVIQRLYDEKMLPTINTHSIQPAIKTLLKGLPQSRNQEIGGAFQFLEEFANGPLLGNQIKQFNETLGRAFTNAKKLLDGFRCYRTTFQLIGNVVQGCKDGRQSFEDLYKDHSTKADLSDCSQVQFMETPTKDSIKQIVTEAAKEFSFNAECQQNQQSDDPGYRYYDEGLDYVDEDDNPSKSPWKLSGGQRHMVCVLKKNETLTESMIAKRIIKPIEAVQGVRCKI